MRKHGLKVLGLVLMAAIGLMAFSATAALAVNLELGDTFYSGAKGEFLINSGTLSPTSLTTQAINGKQIGSSKLLVLAKSAEIVCAKGEATGAVANEYENFKIPAMEAGGHGSATLVFKECKVEAINSTTGALTGTTLTNCIPNFGTTPGEITANTLILVKKHEEATYLLFVPKVTSKATAEANEALTSAFTSINFGPLCVLPSPSKVTGSLVTKAPAADAVKPKLAIDSFSAAGKAEQALLGAKLKFNASEAFVQAEWEVELVGKNVPWGAM
jgi:hypothetical protein